nr:DUF455 family protein [uncultured Nitrosomonas sp.]
MALVPRVLEARGLDITPGIIKRLSQAGDKKQLRYWRSSCAMKLGMSPSVHAGSGFYANNVDWIQNRYSEN